MTIISDAPNEAQTVSLTLPNNIAAPKFHLFQKVRISKHRSGIITGIEFVTLETALLQCVKGFGWKYIVNYVYAASPEEVIKFEDDPTDEYWEHLLEAVEG